MGLIWIYQINGSRLAEPFADFTSTFVKVGATGLLGLTFHPDYTDNGLAYVYGTMNSTTGDFYNSVVEYHVSVSDPNKLDLDTERIVFQIQCGGPRDCHNGGAVGSQGANYIGGEYV
jgi:glucose/arabinose dehydrogenase